MGALLLIAVIAGMGAIFLVSSGQDETFQPPGQIKTGAGSFGKLPLNKGVVHLYFADREKNFLTSEDRVLPRPDGIAAFGKIITEALFSGPQEGHMPTVPQRTALRGFFVADDQTAYVDISETIASQYPGGARTEMLTVYSIVNSLVLNVPEIDSVKILIGGREALTLAGHIDLRFPIKANMLLIR
jgi:hypothetical protein